MTEPEITEDDVRAMRQQGDLSAYLRSLLRRSTPPAEPKTAPGYGPHHRPGAWPAGTHPPTSAICQPDCPCAPRPPP